MCIVKHEASIAESSEYKVSLFDPVVVNVQRCCDYVSFGGSLWDICGDRRHPLL
jgi:hypothetical protein